VTKKELVSRPLYLPGGAVVKFINVGDDTGVLATEDGYVASELSKLAARKKGGIIETDQATYDDLKKNPLTKVGSLSNSNNAQELRQHIRMLEAKVRQLSGVAEDKRPSPVQVETPKIEVPRDIPRPVTKRVSELAVK